MLPVKFSWRIFLTIVILGMGIVFPLEIAYASFISSSVNQKNSISSGYWIAPTIILLPTATFTPVPTATPTPPEIIEPTVTETPVPTETLTPTPEIVLGHLLINEVSPLGSSSEEWVELYNPTQLPINVSGWIINDNSGTDIIPSVSPILGLGYGVIVGKDTTVTVPPSARRIQLTTTTIGGGLNDSGGDKVILSNPSVTSIDQMSYGNVTPTVFFSPPSIPATGKTLSRIPNGVDTDSGSDWKNNTIQSIGAENI